MERNSAVTQLIDGLHNVNRQIGELFDEQRQMGGRLHSEGAQRFEALHLTKNRLLVNALEMRKKGERRIEMELFGKEEDTLHPYSRNQVKIIINNGSFYRTNSKLDNLRRVFAADIVALAGRPDSFIEEECKDYIIRTIVETNDIGHAVDMTRQDPPVEGFTREVELSRLKLELAKRILRLRARGEVISGELTVEYLRDRRRLKEMDLIAVSYVFDQKRWGLHIILDAYKRDLALQRLIEEGGGFDRKRVRKKHY